MKSGVTVAASCCSALGAVLWRGVLSGGAIIAVAPSRYDAAASKAT